MVKQIIIDMEEQLQNAVQGLGSVMASEREMLKKLNEARARQTMLIARDKVAEARKEVISAIGDLDSSGAFAKMDKMEKKIAEKEAQADAAFDISRMDDAEDDEFEEMENKQATDDELARLKEELSKE